MRYLIGLGNYNLFDDSIALKIIEHIEKNKLDNGFIPLDLSANALNLICYLNNDTEKIVIIDTASMGLKPGEYKIFERRDVISKKNLSGISSHESDMIKVIDLAEKTGYPICELKLFGIQPEIIKEGFGLSKSLQDNFLMYVEKAVSEVKK